MTLLEVMWVMCRTSFISNGPLMGHGFWNTLKMGDRCSEGWILEVIRGVGDPVGHLVLRALGRAVGGEQGLEDLRLLRHLLIGPFVVGRSRRLGVLRRVGGSGGSGHSWVVKTSNDKSKRNSGMKIRTKKDTMLQREMECDR